MWLPFTELARRAVFGAHQAAVRYGTAEVAPGHLLLGLVQDSKIALQMLRRMGISTEALRAEIESRLPRADAAPGADRRLTPAGKQVIDLANEYARRLGADYVGTEHLLLGLLAEGQSPAARLLREYGADLDRFYQECRSLQGAEDAPRAG